MRTAIISMAIIVLASSAGMAADAPKVNLDAQEMPIQEAMTDVSNQADVQIVCDSDVSASISGQFSSIELDKLLDVVARTHNLKWQKLYLPVQPDQRLTTQQIKARAEAVAALTAGTVVVCDPATGKQKVFVEQDAATPSVEPAKLGLKPVYFISKPKVETADTGEEEAASRFQELQNERMKLLAEMDSEQRVAAMQDEMMAMIYLDPMTRQQMLTDQMNARRNMDPQMREAYQEIMRETFRSMREQGIAPDFGRGGGFGMGVGRRERPDGPRDRTGN